MRESEFTFCISSLQIVPFWSVLVTNAVVGLTIGVSSSNMQVQIMSAYLLRSPSPLELSAITTGSVIGSMLGALTLPLLTRIFKREQLIILASAGLIVS